nr:hypothetical protein [Tanacetum cinerariifolium]
MESNQSSNQSSVSFDVVDVSYVPSVNVLTSLTEEIVAYEQDSDQTQAVNNKIHLHCVGGTDHNKRTCPGRFKGHGEGDVVQESVNVQEGGVVAQESVDVQKEGIVGQEFIDVQEEGGMAPKSVDVQEERVVTQESVELQEEGESSSEDDEELV